MHMADQRHIADEVRKQLVDNHAVGEALGQYCDMDGKLIYSTNNIGLSLPDVAKIPNVLLWLVVKINRVPLLVL